MGLGLDSRSIWRTVLLFGLVSLFADVAYEGARGVIPNYLVYLGATLVVVGIASGVGEFLGYVVRLLSGILADRWRIHWPLAFLGYAAVLAIPLLALARDWRIALALVIVERFGKGVRAPPRDALLGSLSSSRSGRIFGVHEVLDQVGAIAGPLLVAYTMSTTGEFDAVFYLLSAPAVLSLAALCAAKMAYPKELTPRAEGWSIRRAPRQVLLLTAASSITLVGLVHPAFIIVEAGALAGPLVYAVAMAVDALAAFSFGHIYDLIGRRSLYAWFLMPPAVALLLKQPLAAAVVLGVFLGVQESAVRAAVSDVAGGLKASSFGLFHSAVGLAYLTGGILMGWLLDLGAHHAVVALSFSTSIVGLVIFHRFVR